MLKCFYETFQKKLPLTVFEKEFSSFIKYDVKQEESLTKERGMITACDEISVLLDLAKYYKASHLKWTGNQTLHYPFDGILYFNEKNEQRIEISRVLDEKTNQELKKPGFFSRNFTIKGPNFNIEPQKDTENPDTRSFISYRIVEILRKKESQKYKGCWLCIAYYPYSITSKLNEDYVKEPVLKKIECGKKSSLISNKKIV